MANGFWVKVKPQGDIYGTPTWRAVSNIWVKTTPTSWESVSDMWVKVKPSADGYGTATWKTLYSAGTSPVTPLEILLDYNANDLVRLQGKNYRWSPTPSTLQYMFSVVNATTGEITGLQSFTNTTNPSTGSSITLPGSTTYRTVADGEVFPGVLNTFQFIVKGTTGSGLSFISKAESSIRVPKAPTITATTLSTTSVRLTITAASSEDFDATYRYIVYLNDGTANRYAGNTVGITGLGGYGANSDPVEVNIAGLIAGRSYTFYAKPITGSVGSTLSNYSGYGGITGSLSFQDATPINQVRPEITGTPAPGQTVFVDNGTWTQSPTSFTYQWKRSTNAQSYENISGATSNSYAIPTNFISSGYNYLLCTVTAIKGSLSASVDTFTKQVIAQQLVTPVLSLGTQGYTTFPKGYATINVNNFYQSYTGAETWSASISPSTGVSVYQNIEFPEEWIFSNLNASTSYTVTISVSRSGFIGASQTIQFTSLVGGVPTIVTSPSYSLISGQANKVGSVYRLYPGTWTNSPTNYELHMYRNDPSSYDISGFPVTINSSTSYYDWTATASNVSLSYSVYAINGLGYSSIASASPSIGPITQISATSPTSVTAANNGSTTTVTISWSGASLASYYRIRWVGFQESGIDPSQYYDKQITASNSTSGSWAWGPGDPDRQGITPYPGTAYYYYVSSSIDGITWSPYVGTTTAVGTVANAPTGGSVSVNPSTGTAGTTTYTASVSGWSGTGTISYSYSWQRFTNGVFQYQELGTGTTFSPTVAQNSTALAWQVVVTASNGISPNGTASASFSVSAPVSKLATPTGVNASDNRTDGVLVTWNAVSGAAYYGVWYGGAPGYDSNPDFGGPNNPSLITGTSYLDTAIGSGVTRDYYVQAFASGNPTGSKSDWGGPNSGTRTVAVPLPSTPTGLSASTNRSTDVFISWNASANASTYEIWWGGPPSDSSPPDFFPGSSTFYFDNGISQGSSRTYYVRARNSAGASPWSGGVTGTRTNPVVVVSPPSTPTGVNTSGSGLVSWNASSGATSYTVEYYTATNSSGANATGPYYGSPGGSTSFQISYPVVNSVLQNWARARVLASNSGGNSDYSGFSPSSGYA
jgi:hypothetical protein